MKRDTDDDGMDDRLELAAGLDPKSGDENHNGQNDGFEDFDDDTYINREEAICGTNARSASAKPDGTSASLVNIFGTEAPILLVRNETFEFQSSRDATFAKPGFSGFLPGSVIVDPLSPSGTNGQQGAGNQIDSRIRFYLKQETSQTWSIRVDSKITEVGIQEFDNSNWLYSTSDSVSIEGNKTVWETYSKSGLDYIMESSQDGVEDFFQDVNFNAADPFHDEYHHFFLDPDDNQDSHALEFAEQDYKIHSDREKAAHFSESSSQNNGPYYRVDYFENSSNTIKLSDEYTDSRLLADLNTKFESTSWRAPSQYETLGASFLWDNPYTIALMGLQHASAGFKDAKYCLVSNVVDGIPSTTIVKFIWKEVFVPQEGEGGEIKVKWFEEGGIPLTTGAQSGQFATITRELKHPDKPGSVIPDYNHNGIYAPSELAALNHGETDSQGNGQPDSTHRAKPISFQVDLADQKKNPQLSASGTGGVLLWERKKDGTWDDHTLPFNIPAEQAAGLSSDPGRYMIQGTAAGVVTLQIIADGAVRDEQVVHVRQVDLDIDSDNSGVVDQSNSEELVEEDASLPGKILPGGDAMESDANGIPLHPEKFTSIKLKAANFPTYATVTFRYPDQAIKIWKTPPGQTPTSADLLVPGHSYSPSELGISAGATAELSVQAISSGLGLVRIGISCAGADDGVLVNLPIKVMDNAFATGVDDVSCTVKSTDPGYQPDTWIMAPSGTVPGTSSLCVNDTHFKISSAAGFQLHAAAPAAGQQFTVTPGSFPAQGQARTPEGWPVVSWHGESAATADPPDVTPVWTVTPTQGSPATINVPVKVKVMKRRTVKVKVYLVDLTASDGSRRALDPALIPSEDSIEGHLNDVFAKQINAWFDVEIVKDKDPQNQQERNFLADQRTDGDISFNVGSLNLLSIDQTEVIKETGPVGVSDIRVFMVSTIGIQGGYGITNRTSATCWVAGLKTSLKYENPEDVLSTIGHEIGHVLVGEGHPDITGTGNPADLVGTTHPVRLMCSGPNRDRRIGKLLVKAEWDTAEVWLSNRPNGDR